MFYQAEHIIIASESNTTPGIYRFSPTYVREPRYRTDLSLHRSFRDVSLSILRREDAEKEERSDSITT